MKKYEDYIVIQAWQRDLNLPDKLEKLYAMIWNISKDGRSRMRATSAYIAEWCHCSQRHAQRMIYALEDMGLVTHEVVYDHRTRCNVTEFWAVIPEDAERPERGKKEKISWCGKGGTDTTPMSQTVCDTHVVNQHDTHVVNHSSSNINNNTTRNKYKTTSSLSRAREDKNQLQITAFNPPTIQEVELYAREQGFADPAGFADYYVRYQTEAGWMTGKGSKRKPIDNWKLNVIAWRRYRKDDIFSNSQPAAEPERTTRPLSAEEMAKYFPDL